MGDRMKEAFGNKTSEPLARKKRWERKIRHQSRLECRASKLPY
jgi:hypothetical protein